MTQATLIYAAGWLCIGPAGALALYAITADLWRARRSIVSVLFGRAEVRVKAGRRVRGEVSRG